MTNTCYCCATPSEKPISVFTPTKETSPTHLAFVFCETCWLNEFELPYNALCHKTPTGLKDLVIFVLSVNADGAVDVLYGEHHWVRAVFESLNRRKKYS